MLLVRPFFLFALSSGHKNALFEEMRRRDNRVCIQLAVVFDLLNAHKVVVGVNVRANVGISGTRVDQVTDFLATVAADVFNWLISESILFVHLLIFFFRLVLRVLATWLVFAILTAAPPYLS